jgi:hypothetical protein
MFSPDALVDELAAMPGVVAVVLGGSRAEGRERPDSDWDLGIYYEPTSFSVEPIRALGLPGQVFGLGEWSRLMDGGAWLEVDGAKVDLIYRSVPAVAGWIEEASAGRFSVELLGGYLAGFPTTVLVGEVALATVLRGRLPFAVDSYPSALRSAAPTMWRARRDFSLRYADMHAARGDALLEAGNRARAAVEDAHAAMSERGEWVLNEKGLLARVNAEPARPVQSERD